MHLLINSFFTLLTCVLNTTLKLTGMLTCALETQVNNANI